MEAPLAVAAALDAVASIAPGGLPLELAGLVALVSDVQQLRNRLDGLVNDVFVALARVDDAARRAEFGDEESGADFIGRVAEYSQTPELVAPCLGVSVHVAENRVLTALDLAERAPELVEEMRQGRLEAFRAGLIHHELADAPAHVEDEIVGRLIARADRVGGWTEAPGPLLWRTRSLLAKLAPEVLAARVVAARGFRGLHKRGESECLDRWDGLYHVEDSRMAWAAIDDLAQQILKSGAADTLAQARADAHMQLLLGHCEVTVHLHATTPADQTAAEAANPRDTPARAAEGNPHATTTSRTRAQTTAADHAAPESGTAATSAAATSAAATSAAATSAAPTADHAAPESGTAATPAAPAADHAPTHAAAVTDPPPATTTSGTGTTSTAPVVEPAPTRATAVTHPPPATTTSGTGTTSTASVVEPAPGVEHEPTHAAETDPPPATTSSGTDATSTASVVEPAPMVEVGGLGGPGFTVVRRDWLEHALATGRAVRDDPVTCHPDTGAVLDGAIAKGFTSAGTRKVAGDETDPRYRIPEPMARLVRFRDRQCRFPGCAISSRFCDLDHVTPWPDGPTSPANLMALCRRHHRLKQSPGWSVEIHPDLTVTWTDPIGRTHTSYPSDHLGLLDDDWPAAGSITADPITANPITADPIPETGVEQFAADPVPDVGVGLSPLEARLSRLLMAA